MSEMCELGCLGKRKQKYSVEKTKRGSLYKEEKEKGMGNTYSKQIILIKVLFLIMGKEF